VDYVDHNDLLKSKTYNGFAFKWIMWIIMIHSKNKTYNGFAFEWTMWVIMIHSIAKLATVLVLRSSGTVTRTAIWLPAKVFI
jgi:hypothetical protein